MGQPLSMDLRSRVLAAIDDGTSCRAAAVRFGVAPSTAIRWFAQRRKTGGFAPSPRAVTCDHAGLRSDERISLLRGKRARTSRSRNCVRAWSR